MMSEHRASFPGQLRRAVRLRASLARGVGPGNGVFVWRWIAQPAGEPGADAFQDVDLVGSLGVHVVLARVDHQVVLGAELHERPVEVHCLADRDVAVVFAVQDQHRGCHLRGVRDRAELVVAVRAGAFPAEAAAVGGLFR
jgi:hypothetical protein